MPPQASCCSSCTPLTQLAHVSSTAKFQAKNGSTSLYCPKHRTRAPEVQCTLPEPTPTLNSNHSCYHFRSSLLKKCSRWKLKSGKRKRLHTYTKEKVVTAIVTVGLREQHAINTQLLLHHEQHPDDSTSSQLTASTPQPHQELIIPSLLQNGAVHSCWLAPEGAAPTCPKRPRTGCSAPAVPGTRHSSLLL